nr:MAG TPA: hypothetical protein [Caudoviricetes sp.]
MPHPRSLQLGDTFIRLDSIRRETLLLKRML